MAGMPPMVSLPHKQKSMSKQSKETCLYCKQWRGTEGDIAQLCKRLLIVVVRSHQCRFFEDKED